MVLFMKMSLPLFLQPIGLLVVEQCRIQMELYTELPNAFSITFANDFEKRHYFGCQTQKQAEDWISCLKSCSYEHQRTMLKELQEQLLKRTGRDPLSAFSAIKWGVYKPNLNLSERISRLANLHLQ
ncbi:pleckstrin y domain-containing family J member 1 [Caerostris extrusa]|uniref:Pleckstrin y domain-containing family J member 1 n=1 Tax=Caerostris extrusa TaxID=172846 RepID=A0AAV4WBA9_CAEEX|nr:pleckstrin y domain-containing family J member 1 [Caerostris extrusa]